MKGGVKGHEKSPEDGRKMCGTWTKLGVFGVVFFRRLSAKEEKDAVAAKMQSSATRGHFLLMPQGIRKIPLLGRSHC